MFGDVNVKVEDGNLGRSSSTGTGTSIKIGISNVESKSPILISGTMNAKKIKEKVGNTPLADACIDAVEWGASSIYCIPVKAGTAGTIGEITEDKKGYGTFEVKGSPNNAYDIVVEVMDAGECNEGSFRYSLDGGNTFTEEMTIPITGEAELATTGLTMIIVTHEMAFARDVSSRTIFMDQGYIVEDAAPSELFVNPKNTRTREFLSRYLAG